MSHAVTGQIAKLIRQVGVLQEENHNLKGDVDYLKDIVHNTLMKNNPDYKRKKVLGEMDDFLNTKYG